MSIKLNAATHRWLLQSVKRPAGLVVWVGQPVTAAAVGRKLRTEWLKTSAPTHSHLCTHQQLEATRHLKHPPTTVLPPGEYNAARLKLRTEWPKTSATTYSHLCTHQQLEATRDLKHPPTTVLPPGEYNAVRLKLWMEWPKTSATTHCHLGTQ